MEEQQLRQQLVVKNLLYGMMLDALIIQCLQFSDLDAGKIARRWAGVGIQLLYIEVL